MLATHEHWIAPDATYRPDRYYRYADLTTLISGWASDNPELVAIESIGTTYGGRDIWALTVTDFQSAGPETKPAYFVDANIHAGEVTGVATVLWLINHLLTHREDESIRHLLETTTLYAVPAISTDGMERILNRGYSRVRSSVRPFPENEPQDGLHPSDIDGDGIVCSMRIADPDGPWKVSALDSRVMVKRGPDERGGEYFFVLPEGLIRNWDGGAVTLAPTLYGLDINRNFPLDWGPHWEQQGSGRYPLSEPETRALADFLIAHPNIHGSQHFHTWSAAILRPSARKADEDLAKLDLRTFKAIGDLGTEETGYPCISVFHDFAYDKKTPIRGVLMDWLYEHLGIFPYSTELWSLPRKAGIQVTDFIEFMKNRDDSVDVAMLRVLDEIGPGVGFKPWTRVEHPQLGSVEIGGWDYPFSWQNPPGPLLEQVTSTNARFVLRAMGTAPGLVFRESTATHVEGDIYRIDVTVQNPGFLPTHVSEFGKSSGLNKPVKITLDLPQGVSLVGGKPEQDVGHLDGRVAQYESMGYMAAAGITSRARVTWIVQGERGSRLTCRAHSTKAGSVVTIVTLPVEGGDTHAS